MTKGRTNKQKIDYDMPIGKLVRIPDFLPPPDQLEIRKELGDSKLLKTIAEGRRAIRGGVQGISLSASLKKRKRYRSTST